MFLGLNSGFVCVWFVNGTAEGFGKIEDVVDFPVFLFGSGCFGVQLLLEKDGAVGVEDGLGDVAEDARFLGRNAAADEGVEDSGHDVRDVFGIGEVTGGFGEFGGEGFVTGAEEQG